MFKTNPCNLRVALLVAAALVLPGFVQDAAAQTPIKIAVVDLDLVVGQSAAGKQLQAKLEKFQQDIQGEAEAMQGKARDLRQRITDGANSLSDEKLAELQKQYEDETIAIRRFRDDKQREGQKMQTEGLREIERQLQPVFEAIRDAEGYDLILNNVPGVVVMANDKVDITAKVVERMNAKPAPAGG